jgi:GTP pyrophosphokinase
MTMMNVKEFAEKNPTSLIGRAYNLSKHAHANQKRKSGEPYFIHPLSAAQYVADWKLDEQSIAAALLHDVVEDTSYPLSKIREEFGEEVAFLVDGVTKLGRIKYRGIETQVENLRKMILALSEDIRVIIIKLADRLHNMRTLSALPHEKQKRIALETMDIYAPLAYRLGMQHLSGELEDLAFPYIYPQEYKWIIKNVKDRYEERERYLERVKPIVIEELKKNGIVPLMVDSRAKRYSSLYKKLLRYDMDIEKIYDLVALRIIVSSVEECYAVLGIIHKLWPPLPGRIKDYIALPKPNGYRSLHTTVFCLDQKITEIQIRTKEMHEEAENGIAAHWAYEQAKGSKTYLRREAITAEKKELAWVEQLRSWQKEFTNPQEFLNSLKIDFFKDRIFAITPKGDVIDLPAGSTPVDFAYQIHSEIGDACAGAKVNGKIVPLNYELKSGDLVEIMTQKGKLPSESWLEFVKTSSARNHIKARLRSAGRHLEKGSLARISHVPTKVEFKITVEDRIGLLKDISSVISRAHLNISSLNTQNPKVRGKFPLLRVVCDTADKNKITKVMLKLKAVTGVREISYRLLS